MRFAGLPVVFAAAAVYLAAMALFWVQLFFWPNEASASWRAPGHLGRRALFVGAAVHLVAIGLLGPAMFTTQPGVVELFAWILVVTYLMIGDGLGQGVASVVTPVVLVATLYGAASLRHGSEPVASGVRLGWLAFHVVIILGAYVSLAFAFCASTLYLVQEGLLKRRQLRGLWLKLPPLQVADLWIYRASSFGLALLTVGIVTGLVFFWKSDANAAAWRDPTVLFSVATWCTFALYLLARCHLGWHGRRSNLVVIGGFLLLVVSFVSAPHVLARTSATQALVPGGGP